MKNFKLNKRNAGAAGVASKACAWILSIMMVVTGLAPSFAANNKATKAGSDKTSVTNSVDVSKKASKKSSSASVKKQSKGEAQSAKAPKVSQNNKNDKKADNIKASSISPKQVVTLKNQMTSKVRAVVSNGYSSYYKNFQKSSSNLQNIKSQLNSTASLKAKAASSIKQRTRSSKPQKSQSKKKVKKASKDKDGDGRKKKFNKKGISDDLNDSGNVYYDADSGIFIKARSTLGQMDIFPRLWRKMIDFIEEKGWEGFTLMCFESNGIRLFESCYDLFRPDDIPIEVKIKGCENIDTSKVINMGRMFEGRTLINPDVSKWRTHNVTNMERMFAGVKAEDNSDLSKWDVSKWDISNVTDMSGMFNNSGIQKVDLSKWSLNAKLLADDKAMKMFTGCSKLEYLKTPVGLHTSISVPGNENFKVVRVKKGDSATIEEENNNLNSEYVLNQNRDKNTSYHIYRKDKYAGVIFDKNDGNSEAWANHEIVEKGRGFKFGGGVLPTEKPTRTGYTFKGWSTYKDAATPNFNENTVVNNDMIVYPVWEAVDFLLNSSGNVRAKLDKKNNIIVTALNTSGDMSINRINWGEMAEALGGKYENDSISWQSAEKFNINFNTDGIYLPEDSSSFFEKFTSAIKGCDKLKTDNVTNMNYMFQGTTSANPDVSKWNTSKVTAMRHMFEKATSANPDVSNWDTSRATTMEGMFKEATLAAPNVSSWNVLSVTNMDSMFCRSAVTNLNLSKWKLNQKFIGSDEHTKLMFRDCMNIKCLKTPKGLKTNITGPNIDFKIVKLKKGTFVTVENEGIELDNEYNINSAGDKNAMYHIYRKDKYVGVIFNRNEGDEEAWINHEMVEKGKSINESGGNLPVDNPTLAGEEFLGWSTKKDINTSMFDENIKVNEDTTVYALWKNKQKINVTFDSNGGDGTIDMQHLDKDSSYKLPGCTFIPPADKEFDKWSVTVGNETAVYKKPGESVRASDDIKVKALWKEKTVTVPVKVTLHADSVAGYPKVIEVKRGETLGDKLPEKIEKAGYDFLGYSKDKNGDINFFSDTAVKEDMNVYAVYKSQAPVAKKVEAIRLTAGSLRMQLGDLTDVLAIVSPSDATDKRVKFTLDREDIIKIVSADDSAARVEAIGEGTVKVKAEALDGSGVTGEITIEVVRKPAKKVQVKLNAEGVAGYPKTIEAEEGTSLDANLPMDLKKAGYIFRGWSYEKNGEVNFTKHTQVSKNTEIHAVFKKDEVSVLFIAEGAAGFPKVVMVERGKKIGDQLPAAPARTGYDFEGWSTESSFGTVNLTKDTVIDKDTIVYAVFKKQGAIVKKVSSITLGVTKSNIKAGDEADVIASILPSDADDKRLSWESSAPDKLKIEQTGDNFIRIKAEEEGTYTITAKAKDGSNVKASIEIKVLSKISAPISNKVKVMISADGVADYPKLIEIDKNTTLHGKLPADINKPGYKFKGFTKTMGNAADFDDNEVIKEDIRLYAVFEQVTAPTKKVAGIELSKSKSKVAVGDTVDILPSITPEDADNKALDYTIDKKDNALIYKNPDGTLRLYAMSKGKVVVTAKATDGSNVTKSIEIEITEAEKEQVTITLNADGINGYPKQLTVDKGEALGNALPNVLDKADYDFRGWSTTPNGMIDVNRLTPMTSSIAIHAVFAKKQVNVRMLAEGVNGYPENLTLDIHSALGLNLPTDVVRTGYKFKGWSKDSFTGKVNVTAATKVNENMNIYAVFERIAPVNKKVESIKIADLSSGVKQKGKEFSLLAEILPQDADDKTLEWSASDPSVKVIQRQNNLVSVIASKEGTYSVTAKAKDGSNVKDTYTFKIAKAEEEIKTVQLLAEDVAGFPKEIKVAKGENLAGRLPMDLEKDGHTFLGWSKTQGAVEADFDASLPVTDDLTLYAVFKKVNTPVNKHKVTFDANGGAVAQGYLTEFDVPQGSTLKDHIQTAVNNKMFTKPGYKFIGFSRSKFATSADYNVEAPVYSNMTLYAVYEEAPEFTDVTIKYDIFDMENVVIENVAEGKPIGSKLDGHVKQRDGFRFLGFAKTQDAVKPDFFRKSIVTNGLVLYPVYKEIGTVDKVKVAFKLNDGTDASLQSKEVIRYESLGDKMPTKDKALERDGYLFTGWAKSKAAKYPDFFRSTTVKGDMTVYAIWKSLYDEKLGQAVLKVAAKAKGYELTIEPPKANLHTGFDIFRSEKKDFKPDKDNKIATVDRNTLKFLDDKADNGKAYYYAVRPIDEDGSYNGTKVTFIGKLSDKVLAAPLPKDKGVTATVAGKGAVSLEFNKTIAAAGYKVTVTAPYDKKFKTIERFVEAGKLAIAGGNKVKANLTGLPMGKFLAFKLEALEADNTKLVEYGNSFAFMMGAVEKLTAKVNKKSRVLNVKFKAMKGVNGYEAKIVIGGKVKTVKLKKGKKKLRGFIVGSIKLPKKKGNYTFTIRAFKKIGKLKYYGQTITKVVK